MRFHTLLRFLAAFVVAPYLLYVGHTEQDIGLMWIGIIVLNIDGYTYAKSLQAPSKDFFVVDPKLHIFFRGVAAFVIAPYMLYAGHRLDNRVLILFGLCTLIVDTVTFRKSLLDVK